MSVGPGKYDDALTLARQQCGSSAAVLIVIKGESGPGFACQADLESIAKLPWILRNTADQIEADLKKGKL
jgi:hypothetical protein